MKIAVLISGSGSNLQALIDACAAGELAAEIAVVLSNKPDVLGLLRAREAHIPTHVIAHGDYDSREDFDAAMVDALSAFAPDLVILAGFMRILTPVFIGAFQGKLLNIHPSLLPKYPGLHTHRRALEAGDEYTGATVHFVTEELDGGPPIVCAKVRIGNGDSAEQLATRVQRREHEIYPLAARWFVESRLVLASDGARLDGKLLPATGVDVDTLDGA